MAKVSSDDMEYQSKLKTHDELIKLGTLIAEEKFEGNMSDKLIIDKKKEINELRGHSSGSSGYSGYSVYTKRQIIEVYDDYIELLINKSDQRDVVLKKLQVEYDDLYEENKFNIIELDEMEKEKDARIEKLRNMCKDRNRKNKILNIINYYY